MHNHLTATIATKIASKMVEDGFVCDYRQVWQVWNTGDLSNQEALASRIMQEFDEYELEPPT